jgi:hypothetical protein
MSLFLKEDYHFRGFVFKFGELFLKGKNCIWKAQANL